MARNPKNNAACELLAAAISTIRRAGVAAIEDGEALTRAFHALLTEPPPCMRDCLWAKIGRYQKCQMCARNYKRLNDLYERG